MPARRPQKGTPLDRLMAFQKSDPKNKRCADCGDFGPTFVCMNFGIFICTPCSGLHREFAHRVKGISLSEWTDAEVDFILQHGNSEAEKYLARCDPHLDKTPAHMSKLESSRLWIKYKYVEKRWLASSTDSKDASPTKGFKSGELSSQSKVPPSSKPTSTKSKEASSAVKTDLLDFCFDMSDPPTAQANSSGHSPSKLQVTKSELEPFDFFGCEPTSAQKEQLPSDPMGLCNLGASPPETSVTSIVASPPKPQVSLSQPFPPASQKPFADSFHNAFDDVSASLAQTALNETKPTSSSFSFDFTDLLVDADTPRKSPAKQVPVSLANPASTLLRAEAQTKPVGRSEQLNEPTLFDMGLQSSGDPRPPLSKVCDRPSPSLKPISGAPSHDDSWADFDALPNFVTIDRTTQYLQGRMPHNL